MPESQVRDLARKLREVAASHIAFSQVAEAMNHLDAHLGAIAYAEEANRERGDLHERVGRLEKLVEHICPDRSADV